MKPLAAILLFSGAAIAASPLAAQTAAEGPTDDVHMSIVYGEDAAPPCPEGVICVVAHLPEGERYRIPEPLRFDESPENQAWTKRVERLDMVGKFGTLSCSPAGAGGFTGCTQKLIQEAYGDEANGANLRFSELIAKARADRLSKIDEQAAAEQERVEAIEKDYMDRLAKERDAALPDESTPPAPSTQPSTTGKPTMAPPPPDDDDSPQG